MTPEERLARAVLRYVRGVVSDADAEEWFELTGAHIANAQSLARLALKVLEPETTA